jgi:hypothetical protein
LVLTDLTLVDTPAVALLLLPLGVPLAVQKQLGVRDVASTVERAGNEHLEVLRCQDLGGFAGDVQAERRLGKHNRVHLVDFVPRLFDQRQDQLVRQPFTAILVLVEPALAQRQESERRSRFLVRFEAARANVKRIGNQERVQRTGGRAVPRAGEEPVRPHLVDRRQEGKIVAQRTNGAADCGVRVFGSTQHSVEGIKALQMLDGSQGKDRSALSPDPKARTTL